jgi:hypothetical protein
MRYLFVLQCVFSRMTDMLFMSSTNGGFLHEELGAGKVNSIFWIRISYVNDTY